MRLAEVVAGVVRNVIEVEPDAIPAFAAGWPEATEAGPGWTYDGIEFFAPLFVAIEPTIADVNAERNRRLAGTFQFAGTAYNCDPESMSRITGAATLAGFAMGAGAQPGNLRWHGGPADFVWIAADNSMNPMDAQTCFAFGQTAAANQSAHIFAARALKDAIPIPADYAEDHHWP